MRKENRQTQSISSAARSRAGEAGFSLLELLVAVLLFTIVTGAIYGLMEVTRADRFTTNQRVEMLKNLRVSLNMMGRDAFNAGYRYTRSGSPLPDTVVSSKLGVPIDPDNTRDLLMAVYSGNDITTNTLSGAKTDQISFVFRDMSFNNSNSLSVNTATLPTGAKATITDGTANTVLRKQDLVVVEGTNSSVLAVVTDVPTGVSSEIQFSQGAGNGDPLGVNLAWANSLLNTTKGMTNPASLSRVYWVSYLVLADGTLVRRVYGNNTGTAASQDQPLAYGIEDMQIQYVMDDGTVTDDPVAGPDKKAGTADDTVASLGLVRQVVINLKARSAEADKRTKQPLKVTLSATFNTRNLGYKGK